MQRIRLRNGHLTNLSTENNKFYNKQRNFCISVSQRCIYKPVKHGCTAQEMKFSIKDFFSKCDQIRRKLRIWSHLLKKSLMENFIFCAVIAKLFANSRKSDNISKSLYLVNSKTISETFLWFL